MDSYTLGQPDSSLLTAAFSAIMELPLTTNVPRCDHAEKVSVFDHHKTTYSYGPVGDITATATAGNRCWLYLKTMDGRTIECDVKSDASIREIKERIHELLEVPPDNQRLIYNGKQLEDGKTMSHYQMTNKPTIHLVAKLAEAKPVILDPTSLDPTHNYDFTNINDGDQIHMRCGRRYYRPCGFKRFALNVSNKYENLLWIGCNNGTGEWPVSYHGTGNHENKTLAENGCVFTPGRAISFTRGIYSTPDVHVAEKYAKKFTYNNEQYLVIFQNRVNPRNLVEVRANQTGAEEYWINPSEDDVRPYGICIRKVQK